MIVELLLLMFTQIRALKLRTIEWESRRPIANATMAPFLSLLKHVCTPGHHNYR